MDVPTGITCVRRRRTTSFLLYCNDEYSVKPVPPTGQPSVPNWQSRAASGILGSAAQSTKRKDKAPPRVDITLPWDTSPELYSFGEETASEERFEVAEEGNWVNGMVLDDGTE